MRIDEYQRENNSLPAIGSDVSVVHPVSGVLVEGTISTYTCEYRDGVSGVYVQVQDEEGTCVIDCRMSDAEVS